VYSVDVSSPTTAEELLIAPEFKIYSGRGILSMV
jgi:hypothetical protein